MNFSNLVYTRHSDMATTLITKSALRKEIASKIRTLSVEEKIKQSSIVIEKLFRLKAFIDSERVSVFLSIDNEINTEPIVRKVLQEGKKCYIPRFSKTNMEMVRLRSMEDWENLPLTKFNIKQPALSEPRENAMGTGGLDLIIAPGVAFSTEGVRLGHGGGYYDRFISKCREVQKNPPQVFAVAFKEQILDFVPHAEHDAMVDLVLYAD